MARTRDLLPRLVDKQFRVVLPGAVAAALGVGRGDHVAFTVEGGEVRLRKVRISLE